MPKIPRSPIDPNYTLNNGGRNVSQFIVNQDAEAAGRKGEGAPLLKPVPIVNRLLFSAIEAAAEVLRNRARNCRPCVLVRSQEQSPRRRSLYGLLSPKTCFAI
jgi:hypothetical protein